MVASVIQKRSGGTPVSGMVVERQASSALVDVAGYRVAARGVADGSDTIKLLLRPEALRLADDGLAATVQESTYRGAVYETRLELANGERLTLDSPSALRIGETVHVAIADAWIIPG